MQRAAHQRWKFIRLTLASASLFASWSASAASAKCQLQSIELEHPGDLSEWLTIVTDRPANFTSFKLSRPTRIVVDFPETAAQMRKTEGPSAGPVAKWSVETLGTDEQSVARLTVELRQDADYTLTSNGGMLELRFLPVTARPLTALEQTPPPAPKVDEAAPKQREDEAKQQAAKEKAAREKAEQDRLQQEKLEKDRLERERLENEERAKKVAAEQEAKREAEQRAEAEKARKLAAERERQEQEAARAKALAEQRAKEEARRAALAIKPVVLEHLAFHRSEGGAEFAVKLSGPAAYTTREEAGKLVLELEHTKITLPNNRRELDTRFFGTAVTRIVPREDRANARVSIVLELGSAAPYEVKAEGSTIRVSFGQAPALQKNAGLMAAP